MRDILMEDAEVVNEDTWYGTLDVNIGMMTPIPEKMYKKMQSLCAQMINGIRLPPINSVATRGFYWIHERKDVPCLYELRYDEEPDYDINPRHAMPQTMQIPDTTTTRKCHKQCKSQTQRHQTQDTQMPQTMQIPDTTTSNPRRTNATNNAQRHQNPRHANATNNANPQRD
ncbi:11176_t:CDS:2 [Paraglomus brasilianum]|uniref:11176_t:CDS:1 n=1 Tax=Paraglomus brasilianum TaxID=144538 RepID=A0A9N9C8H9_9GLOM|nr:11176_t:CDS:2 [Paraglomus brasilianum]